MAPDPDRLPGARSVARITAMYDRLAKRISDSLLKLAGGNVTPAVRRRFMTELTRAMSETRAAAEAEMVQGVRVALRAGTKAPIESARGTRVAGAEARRVIQANLQAKATEIEAAAVQRGMGYLTRAEASIGRTVDDQLRRISLRQVSRAIEGEATLRDVAGQITESVMDLPAADDLIEEISGRRFIVDRGGRHWDPSTYARLVARTTTREAQSAGFIARTRAEGVDLVKVSEHAGGLDDPICAPYHGRVFSLDGLTPGVPVLDMQPPFHPNCRHVLLPVNDDDIAATGG